MTPCVVGRGDGGGVVEGGRSKGFQLSLRFKVAIGEKHACVLVISACQLY